MSIAFGTTEDPKVHRRRIDKALGSYNTNNSIVGNASTDDLQTDSIDYRITRTRPESEKSNRGKRNKQDNSLLLRQETNRHNE
jgi:hypothetical protein